jgi:hypothetical protein
LDSITLSPTLYLASSSSSHHNPATHWPSSRTATTSSKHYRSPPPPCGSRNYQSPVPRCPTTAIPLLGNLGRTFQLPEISASTVETEIWIIYRQLRRIICQRQRPPLVDYVHRWIL